MPPTRQQRTAKAHLLGLVMFLMLFLLMSVTCVGDIAEGERSTSDYVPISVGIVILILATTAAGWYFGQPVHKVSFLIGIAAFSAACGIGLGLSPQAAFAALVPALAALFGGTLVCAVSAKRPTGRLMSHSSAASGIPLLLGAYLGKSITTNPWSVDPATLASAIIVLALAAAVAILIGRRTKNLELSFGAAAFGAVVGLMTGLSPDPVVAYVAPAALALFTGAASYAFSTGAEQRRSIGGILTCFGILLIVGLFLGAIARLDFGWAQAPRVLFGLGAVLLAALALGSAVGSSSGDVLSGLGFAALGGGVGLAIGLSKSPIIHVAIPSLLAALVGLAIYVMASEQELRWRFCRLFGAFAVVVLLGSFVGYSLRQEELCVQLKRLGDVLERLEEEQRILDLGALAVVEEARDLVEKTEGDPVASVFLWLEGSTVSSALLIDVRTTMTGALRVEERVDGRLLYEGIPSPGEQLALSGESIKISWAVPSGRDAIYLTAWDRMVERDGRWAVDGPGERIETADAEVLGDRFILIYP